MKQQIPVYLFVGQLESGKTTFIQETMEDPQFDSGDKTLLVVCEEGRETAKKFSKEQLAQALTALDSGEYGQILRAKGIVDGGDSWYEFDMVPGEQELRPCTPDVTGKLCVIGSQMDEAKVAALFGV